MAVPRVQFENRLFGGGGTPRAPGAVQHEATSASSRSWRSGAPLNRGLALTLVAAGTEQGPGSAARQTAKSGPPHRVRGTEEASNFCMRLPPRRPKIGRRPKL